MKLLDIVTAPWAITPEKLEEIQAIYLTHLRGEKIDVSAVEARLGRPLANEPKQYQVVEGVAIVEAVGVSAKRANLFMEISGGVSTELLARDLRAADADSEAHSIILRADTPGGTVDGTQLVAQVVRSLSKPVVTLAGGMLASAGYWYGSAADAVYIEDDTTAVGSIGVVAKHIDVSAAREARGERHTEIVAGKYKRIASDNGPLSKEGRATMQEQVDHIYSVFVQAVAEHRGVSVETVLSDMADGRVFLGDKAIAAGLVDGVSTLEALILKLNRERPAGVQARSRATHQPTSTGASMPIDRAQLQAEAPELLQSILAEGRAAGAAEGAAAERERIQSVLSMSMPGHDKLVQQLAFDGKTTGAEAAVQVLAAERKVRGQAAADLAADAAPPAKPAATPAVQPPASGGSADAEADKPLEERCKAKWEASAEIRAEFDSLQAFTAYTRAEEAGQVKRLARKAA